MNIRRVFSFLALTRNGAVCTRNVENNQPKLKMLMIDRWFI